MNLPSNSPQVEYFDFEKDFMEDNIRCIPMIVRFKLDACGIKLKLKEWSKMDQEERENLALLPIDEGSQLKAYLEYLEKTVIYHTGEKPTSLEQQNLLWTETDQLPLPILNKLKELNQEITLAQWKSLSVLKRYALLKLSRPGHENRNFPKALKEFGLT
jgi:hypothetical protein